MRLDLQAAGLGPRPPSVISSDQEYPPLEHKDIPVPSPYAKRLQNEETVSSSNAECKAQAKLPSTEQAKQNHSSNTVETIKINSVPVTETISEAKVKSSASEGVCQKTMSNAKNDQIKISVKEKIAKNREEVSGKRSSFTETESKIDSVDKVTYGVANRSQETSSLGFTAKESKDEEKYTTEVVSKSEISSSRKECIAAVNSVLMSKKAQENVEQPQTTWEQEKQKAEMAKLRLSENYSQPASPLPASSVISQRHSGRRSNEYSTSESSLMDDSDSSDTKTVVNSTECAPTEEPNDTVAPVETPSKVSVNHITPVTPDTMTPDEAENLLSSR